MSAASPESNLPIFRDVSRQAGVTATHRATWNEYSQTKPFTDGYMAIGQAWGDYDNDGWLDLYMTGNLDANTLLHNNGDGTFSPSDFAESVRLPELMTGGAIWADYDNDGWRDLFVLAYGANQLFHNEQGNGFRNVTIESGIGDTGKGTSAAWADYDNDGWLDLYVTNWSCFPKCDPVDHTLAQDRLYHNRGDGTFEDVSSALNVDKLLGAGFAVSFVDVENDGDLDLYVVNDMLQNPIGNVLWRNDGRGCGHWCWTDISEPSGANLVMNGMGIAVGDYDNDLDLDLYLSNMVRPMALLRNSGNGTFGDEALRARVGVGPGDLVGWGTDFFDYDNDGWLDLFLTTTEFQLYEGSMHLSAPNYLFRNLKNGRFDNVSRSALVSESLPSMGIATADYDKDGWVDFILGNWNQSYLLYRNLGATQTDNHWLTIRLVGDGPVNRDAIGTKVYLTTSDGLVQMRDVRCGSSLGAGNDTALHFGLGAATMADLHIIWPNGKEQVVSEAVADQMVHVKYDR
ncbi:CRTAC1 family protein [Chloroflexi bacterium TSY]|nr:CRTAC1 family protein [Chloroflexi bacterium TSY]